MRSRGPLITLLAGLALAGVLVTLSMNATQNTDLASGPGNVPASPGVDAADVAPEAEAEPEPSEEAQPEGEEADAGENGEAAEDPGLKETTWAGDVSDSDATVAIVGEGDEAIAYVCDGEDLEVWLHGSAEDGKLDLATLAKSPIKAKLTASFGNGRAKGSITVDGDKLSFNVKTVKKPSGLFRAAADVRGAKLEGGWIVLPDGTQVGLASFAGSPVAVPPLDLDTRTTTVFGERIIANRVRPGGGS